MSNKVAADIPSPGEGKRGEQGYLAYLLRQASASVRLAIERALADFGVTQPQFLVMTMIHAYPGLSSADVARLALLTPQTISLIVANLERNGRLTRVVSPAHGRVYRMELTESGRDLLAACRARAQQIDALLIASLPPGLEPALRRWLVDVVALDLTISIQET